MSTTKILYKTKKWDKDVQERIKMKSSELRFKNIEYDIMHYKEPESSPYLSIKDEATFYHLLGNNYFLIADGFYIDDNDITNFIKHIYIFILAVLRSYELEESGVEITNSAIKRAHEQQRDIEKIIFSATAIGKIELFEKYGTNTGCEIIKAMYHEDYEKAEELVTQLPDTAEIYEKEKYWASYCYESKYLKALYQAILSKDEEAFNKALADRIKFIRKGYVMPVDVVSVTMIKFARKLGMDYNFDVIEIPKALLEDLSDVPFDEYKLPIV